jgi:hypothetical protein
MLKHTLILVNSQFTLLKAIIEYNFEDHDNIN